MPSSLEIKPTRGAIEFPMAQITTGCPWTTEQFQQLEQKLNVNQKNYEIKQEELEILPTSRLDCDRRFPPAPGRSTACSKP